MISELKICCPYIIKKPIKILKSYIPDRRRFGENFIKAYDFLQESQWWSTKQIKDYQLMQLHKIINHAYNNVPYYKKVFDERGLKPEDISDFDDLKKLPYLTKDIIRENINELLVTKYNKKKLTYCTTGGSTGSPMGFYINADVDEKEWAFMTNQWVRVGYCVNRVNRMVILRGNIPNFSYYEYIGNNLILSSYKITKENYIDYIDKIQKFNPDFIYVYPSSIIILSKYTLESNIKIHCSNLKAILCGSENIYDYQRKIIKEVFSCRVYSWYGHSEKCCLAGECEDSSYYHIYPEYGYTELINNQGKDASKEDELCEIVATGFNNYAMPFIRYKTCDIAVNSNESCKCGRNHKLIKRINGREQEFFVDKKGSIITFTCSDEALWDIKHKVIAYQYIQNEPGKVLLTMQLIDKLTEKDKQSVIDEFQKVYPSLEITLGEIDNIPRTGSGKFKQLIQNLNVNFSLKGKG